MRRSKFEPIGSILNRFLRQEGLETPLNQHRIVEKWYELMGKGIAAYTGEISIRNQCMIIQIKSPALRENLMMERERLVKRLNQAVGAQVITRIVFS
ncbi:MAG: DUF721 domain-containing protein [Bacteroidales bacterium]|nr:DUF721 domain-containing protein [Candidatus Minthousia equi]